MNPRPLLVVLFLIAGFLTAAAGDEAKPDDQKVAYGLWPVPPDFCSSRGSEPASDPPDDGADPFAAGDGTRKPAGRPRFPHAIAGLGRSHPFDVRSILESLGVTFREGDVALFSQESSLLFVRAHPDQVDIVETLMDQTIGSDPAKHVFVTWRLHRQTPDGASEVLLERSIVCQGGQRSKFQRHRRGREVEMEEVEASIGEDGVSIDLNSAVKLQIEGRVISSTGQAFVRGDDPHPLLLLRTPDKPRGANFDLFVSAKRVDLPLSADGRDFNPRQHRAGLAAAINARVAAIQGSGRKGEKRTELFWAPHLLSHAQQAPQLSPSTDTLTGELLAAKLPDLGIDGLMDARPLLRRLKVSFADDEHAWWSPDSGLLWLDAREAAIAAVAVFSEDQPVSGVNQFEFTFHSWQESPRRRDFAPRSLLVRSGQRSSSSFVSADGRREKTEIEAWGSESVPITDLNVALTAWRMGGETWTLTAQARVNSDGTGPVTLASGMAKDAGGKRKTLTVSSKLRLPLWLELLDSPGHKTEAIKAIAALLPKPQQ